MFKNLRKFKILLLQKFDPEIKDDEQYYIQCPFCDDKRRHLGINFKLNAYHCFRCNSSGNLNKLYSILSSEKYMTLPKIIIPSSKNKNLNKKTSFIEEIKQIFNNYKNNPEYNNKYLKKYCIEKNILNSNYEKLVSLIKFYNDRLFLHKDKLFFLDYNGEIIQVRQFKNKPKYITFNSRPFYLRDPNNYDWITIVESPLSVLAAEILGFEMDSSIVAALGMSNIPKTINLFCDKKITLFPDRDFAFKFFDNLPDNVKFFIFIKEKNDLFDLLSVNNYNDYIDIVQLPENKNLSSLFLKTKWLSLISNRFQIQIY